MSICGDSIIALIIDEVGMQACAFLKHWFISGL